MFNNRAANSQLHFRMMPAAKRMEREEGSSMMLRVCRSEFLPL
jgi:hypothetical protein